MNILDEIVGDVDNGAERLIDEYGGRLTAAAVSLCGNETDAKDLLWETVDIAIRQIRAYRGEAAVFEWLYGIMQNLYRHSFRRKSATNEIPMADMPDESVEGPFDGTAKIVQEIDAGILRDAVNALPPDMRESVALRYFMGMPIGQIAKFLTLPVGTVKSRLHYARIALAHRLGAKLTKPAVALIAAALLLLCATAAVVVGVSNARGERQATPKTLESCGLMTTDDVSVQAGKDSDALDVRTSSAQPLCVATSRPFNLVTVRMQSDSETFQENAGLGRSGLSMPVSRSAVFPSAPERIGDDRSGAALTALDTRVHIVRLGGLRPLDTVVHERKSGPNMNLNCTKRSFTLIFR